jgi:hypothetical protein
MIIHNGFPSFIPIGQIHHRRFLCKDYSKEINLIERDLSFNIPQTEPQMPSRQVGSNGISETTIDNRTSSSDKGEGEIDQSKTRIACGSHVC